MQVKRRGKGTYLLTWELGQEPGTGKRRQRHETFHGSERKAQERWVDVQAEVQKGNAINPSKMPLDEYMEQYFEAASANLRPQTLADYRKRYRHYLSPRIGNLPLDRITPAILQATYSSLLKSGGKESKPLSPRTVQYCHAILHAALEQAVRWDMVWRNAASLAKAPRPQRRPRDMWTPNEARAFLDRARSHRLYALFALAASGAMRQEELLALRWRDVDWTAGTITVARALVLVNGKLIFDDTKNHSSRRTVMSGAATLELLQEHRERQAEERRKLGPYYQNGELIFCRQDGRPLRNTYLTRIMQRICEAAEVPRKRFHDLRHLSATLLLSQGVHPKVVQERLGHSNISVTMDIYSHVQPGLQKEAAERVDAILFGREGERR